MKRSLLEVMSSNQSATESPLFPDEVTKHIHFAEFEQRPEHSRPERIRRTLGVNPSAPCLPQVYLL
jgi:hypothetical protein